MSKCAISANTDDANTCIHRSDLDELVVGFKLLDPSIEIDNNASSKDIVQQLMILLDCENDQCVAHKIIDDDRSNIKSDTKKRLRLSTWKPTGPLRNEWLNNTNIDTVIEPMEYKYPNFKYLGTVPIDIHLTKWKNSNYFRKPDFDKWKKEGKTKFGIVFNLDKHNGGGTHWVSMFIDTDRKTSYYIDSYGTPPPREVVRFMNLYHAYEGYKSKALMSKRRHQYENSECGVYSISFILRMARDTDEFNVIASKSVSDSAINKCRKVYYSPK